MSPPVPNRRVLVTGAAGTVGTILLPHLARIGPTVGLDVRRPRALPAGVDWVDGSVADRDLLVSLTHECNSIVHLARDNPESWAALAQVDIEGTRNVFGAAAKAPAEVRVVFASSLHPVGGIELDHLAGRMTELDEREAFGPLRPDSEYAVAKAFGEAYGRYVAETAGVRTSCLRIGTVRPIDDPARYLDEPGFNFVLGGHAAVAKRLDATWLHHKDLRDLFTEELQAPDMFRLRFAVSRHIFWPSTIFTWNPT